jgi:outer membrane protein OmpA-like peptidoglycan-associated protein
MTFKNWRKKMDRFKFSLSFLLVICLFLPSHISSQETETTSPIFDPAYFVEVLSRAEKANQGIAFRNARTYGTATIRTGEHLDAAIYFHGATVKNNAPLFLAGRSPLQNLKLFTGTHVVTIQHPKTYSITESLTVNTNSLNNVNFPLQNKRAVVKVITNPSGVKVSFGGRQLGITSDTELILPIYEKGLYLIQFEKTGYQTARQSLRIIEGEIHGMNVYLLPNFSSVRISTPDEGFFAYVNNIYRGRTPIKVSGLKPGNANVRVEQDKHAATTLPVLLRPGETASVSITSPKDKTVKDVSPYGELKSSWGDKDGDGIPNNIDNCPDDPEDIDGFEDSDGCPDNDNDNDGIPDIKDKCPNEMEDLDNFNDEDGCPDKDNDTDNIPDSIDLCPHIAEDRDGHQDMDGCPEFDNDEDGIPDSIDVAINEPEDRDSFQDNDGVQDRDNDNDGVWDYLDMCPDSAEVFNNYQDDDGCPDIRLSEPPKGIFARLMYQMDSKLHDSIFTVIDSVYDAMQAYPEIQIEIKVHSDNRGNAPRKLEYTKQVARIISAYLDARKHIQSSRYSVIGIGGSDPLASNVSELGRMKNTRIEIKRLK